MVAAWEGEERVTSFILLSITSSKRLGDYQRAREGRERGGSVWQGEKSRRPFGGEKAASSSICSTEGGTL